MTESQEHLLRAINPMRTGRYAGMICEGNGCMPKCHAHDAQIVEAYFLDTPVADTAGPEDAHEEPWAEAAMWAYQFAGALSTAYDFEEDDIVPLLDLLSALAESRIPSVEWPAVVPSIQAGTRGPFSGPPPQMAGIDALREAAELVVRAHSMGQRKRYAALDMAMPVLAAALRTPKPEGEPE